MTCLPNIGPRERRRRLLGGIVMAIVTVVIMVALVTLSAARAWRIAIFVPVLFTSISFLQVQQKTCIALAARNERNLDHGVERIADGRELQAVKRQARRVSLASMAVAAAITILFLLVP